jgi:hypothetical protein
LYVFVFASNVDRKDVLALLPLFLFRSGASFTRLQGARDHGSSTLLEVRAVWTQLLDVSFRVLYDVCRLRLRHPSNSKLMRLVCTTRLDAAQQMQGWWENALPCIAKLCMVVIEMDVRSTTCC